MTTSIGSFEVVLVWPHAMTQSVFAGAPPEIASIRGDHVSLVVDERIYPLEAVYGAAYTFIDRCYVLIERPEEGRLRVLLSARDPGADEAALRPLVGEFANELLSCAWRRQITQENRAIIEAVTMQAISGAMGPPSLDDLADFDFSSDAFEDPLGIAASWEEKYKKKSDAKSDETTPDQPASGGERS